MFSKNIIKQPKHLALGSALILLTWGLDFKIFLVNFSRPQISLSGKNGSSYLTSVRAPENLSPGICRDTTNNAVTVSHMDSLQACADEE